MLAFMSNWELVYKGLKNRLVATNPISYIIFALKGLQVMRWRMLFEWIGVEQNLFSEKVMKNINSANI